MAALIFRKAIAWAALSALSATLHLVGIDVHLPHVRFGWPWQSVSAGTTTDTDIGPWVLQKIEGISRPALGTENFNFTFTHKVSKNLGIWPCWYSSTFATVGHASATVDLNPGPGWWAPGSGHYRLQVLTRPAAGVPGRVSVAIVLPQPQLPQSVHDVTIDNTLSHPIDVQHSWTYPGLGCGAMIRPQFSVSVLYGQAQNLAFAQVRHNPQVTRPLITRPRRRRRRSSGTTSSSRPSNALGYTLAGFAVRWSAASLRGPRAGHGSGAARTAPAPHSAAVSPAGLAIPREGENWPFGYELVHDAGNWSCSRGSHRHQLEETGLTTVCVERDPGHCHHGRTVQGGRARAATGRGGVRGGAADLAGCFRRRDRPRSA